MKKLDLVPLQDSDKLVFPEEFHELSLESPALHFVTDFKKHHPAVLTASVSAMDAAEVLRAGHLSWVLVMDHRGDFVGLLTAEDASYQRVMQRVAAGQSRDELTVGDLMRRRSRLQYLGRDQLQGATIREVLEAMRHSGQRHCLVVDMDRHHVRGVISSEDVAARLHMDYTIDTPENFAELLRAVSAMH
ncbi:CBS domain-containing protein [Microbulbifer hydrolyticus]|uniref:CBS domain containing-hemolysin-like protein n=1 Tax=Microbulbifer hydrolyticus TaxID=48074 RepID=A0A6P1T8V6_9GAMM|nr:CBS domain-containing protein [Microbulbifer hydrolyticus]MBB5211175.1 CBS domain containing-hemolysin-like protein [Microbulbifer hydrolyticus]QHQ38050.1 CBS domain-containing protein [Microbulbifer hydrolyticus]